MRVRLVVLALAHVLWLCGNPLIARAQTEPLYENGLKPYGAYDGGALDSVSRSAGNLSLHIPLVSYPQRGGKLHMGFFVRFTNPQWSYGESCVPKTACQFYWGANPTASVEIVPDFTMQLDTNVHYFSSTDYETYYDVVSPDGALHQMWGTGSNYLSLDATGTQLNTATNVVVDRNGIQYYYGTGGSGVDPTQIQDPNGNYISANVSNGAITGWTDTLGRTFPLPPNYGIGGVTTTNYTGCTGSLPVSSASLWNLPGPSGGFYTVKVCFAKVQIRTNFSLGQGNTNSHQDTSQYAEIQSIVLPDGTAWTFTWDSADPNNTSSYAYGNLLGFTLPTDGSISYTWFQTWPNCVPASGSQYPMLAQFIITSRTASDGYSPQTWTYSGPLSDYVVTDPLQNQTIHTLTALGTGTCAAYETETKYYQNISGTQTLLKTVDTQFNSAASPWDQFNGAVGSRTLKNVVPKSVTTTWANGQTVNATTGYDSGVSLGNAGTVLYGDAVDKYEYDFTPSGGLLRHTHTNYQAFANSNYLTAGLLDLPSSIIVYNGAGTQVASTTYGYDASGDLTSSGITTHVGSSYIPGSPRGNQTSVSRWLSNGSATSTTSCPVAISSGGLATSTVLFYDTGSVYKDTDPCKNSTTYTYSSTYVGAYPTSIANVLNQAVTHTYDFNTGLVTQTKDPNLQATNYSYNSMWRISQIGYPDTGAATFSYQVTSFPFYVTRTRTMTPTPSAVTTVVFDGLGRETRRMSANGETNPYDQVETCYDGLGRKSFVSYPYQSTGLSSSHFCSGVGDSFLYDTLGRTLSVTHSDGTKILTSYSGQGTEVSDEGNGTSGVTRISQIDGIGRLMDVCELSSKTLIGTTPTPSSCGLAISGTGFLTTYGYDVLGDLLSVTQGGLSSRSFQYDSLSRLTSATNPESGQTTYSYDANSNVIGKTNALPITTTFTYDVLNRLTAKSSSLCPSPISPGIAINYDETSAFGVTLTNTVGRISSSSTAYSPPICSGAAAASPDFTPPFYWPEFGQVFSYDKMGRVIDNSQCTPTTVCPNNATYPVTYTYDLGGNTLTSTDGAAVTITQAYNAASRAISVTSSLQDSAHPAALLSNVQYDAFGIATGDTLGNGLAEVRTTSPRGWLQSLTVGPSGSLAYDFNITSFAPNGDILSASDSVNANWSYGYDDFNRLISASATGQAYTYDYDRFGNRWHQNGPSSMMISFTGNNNLMDTYAYDAAGNLLNDGTHSYAYDGFGRLATVDGGTTAAYYYDADDRRAEKASVAEYLYDLEGNVVAEMVPGTGGLQRGEVYAAGRHLATYWNSTTYFNHADWLGTERARTPYPGSAACETIASLPFGDGQVEADSCGDPSTRHFTGKERDSESGLDNFGARYDTSSMGRFMSPDPLGGDLMNPQSLNGYAYVLNNPLSNTDPTGLYTCKDSTDCSSKADQKFEKTLAGLRDSKDADVARAAAAYGGMNKDNGVTVGFANLSAKGENGNTVSTIGYADGSLRANSDVTINSKIDGDSYAAAIGHEGSHAADAQDVVRSGLTEDGKGIHAGEDITHYQSEVRAWGVTNTILKSGNFTQAFDCGAAACKLGASPAIGKNPILPAQILGAIDQILANQSIYNQGGRPMGPNNQGSSVVNGVTPKASVPH